MPLSLFDKALVSVSNIWQLAPMVVDQFFWSSRPILASAHVESVLDLRGVFSSGLVWPDRLPLGRDYAVPLGEGGSP